jgi:hypothetical protein
VFASANLTPVIAYRSQCHVALAFEAGDLHPMFRSKNQARISPSPISYTGRGHPPAAIVFYIVTVVTTVCYTAGSPARAVNAFALDAALACSASPGKVCAKLWGNLHRHDDRSEGCSGRQIMGYLGV